MTRTIRPGAGALVAAILLAACSGEMPPPDVRLSQSAAAPARWTLERDPIVLVGETDSSPGHALHRISGAILLAGHLAVADRSANEIRIFSLDGALSAVLGGRGGGPDEFASLSSIWLANEGVIGAYDPMRQRITFWSVDGRLPDDVLITGELFPRAVMPVSNGEYLAIRDDRAAGTLTRDSRRTEYASIHRVSSAGEALGVVMRFPARVVLDVGFPGSATRLLTTPQAFGAEGHVVAGDEVLIAGFSSDPWVVRYALDGTLLDTVHIPIAPRAVTKEMVSRFVGERVAAAGPVEGPGVRRFLEALDYPDRLPTYDRLLIDTGQNLWVRHYVMRGDSGATWTVFSGATLLAQLTTPPAFDVFQVTDRHVVGLTRGIGDVERIGVYSLKK